MIHERRAAMFQTGPFDRKTRRRDMARDARSPVTMAGFGYTRAYDANIEQQRRPYDRHGETA